MDVVSIPERVSESSVVVTADFFYQPIGSSETCIGEITFAVVRIFGSVTAVAEMKDTHVHISDLDCTKFAVLELQGTGARIEQIAFFVRVRRTGFDDTSARSTPFVTDNNLDTVVSDFGNHQPLP